MLVTHYKQGQNIGNRYHSHDIVPEYKALMFNQILGDFSDLLKLKMPAINDCVAFSSTKDKV